ncbi:MAG: sigma-70 family RNA polymerase sigma factor [Firmicutes bacterium]|nr:sigma-70 family RNA polymerase sigma factor [Bacillota bacterium]
MYSEINILYEKSLLGDNEALEELIKRLKPLVLSSIKRYYNKIYLYDDLIQEGYEVILNGIKDYDESKGTHLLGYLKMMLKYFYLNKSKYELDTISLNILIGEEDSLELIDTLKDSVIIDEEIIKNEEINKLFSIISKLSERQKYIIYEYYFNNISLKRISKDLNISYRTVVNIKVQGIKKLRKLI